MQPKQEGSKNRPISLDESRYSERADEDDFNEAESSTTSRAPTRKTREELNEIEKQRTKRINAQILSLKGLLEMSNVRTRKDKFSILNSAYEYIMRLKNAMQQIKDRLNNGELVGAVSENVHSNVLCDGMEVMKIPDLRAENSELLLRHASVPMALMSLDAKFIACNSFFSEMTGYSNHELVTMSLFNLAGAEEMRELFSSIGNLIEHNDCNARHFWKRFQFLRKEVMCFTSLWIVNNEQGIPSYIQLMLMSLDGCVTANNNITTTPHASSISSNSHLRNIGNIPADHYTPKSLPITQSHTSFDHNNNTTKSFRFQPTTISNPNPMSMRSHSFPEPHNRLMAPTSVPPPSALPFTQPVAVAVAVDDDWMIHSLMQMKGTNNPNRGFSSSNNNNMNSNSNGNNMSLSSSSSSQLQSVGPAATGSSSSGLFHNHDPSSTNCSCSSSSDCNGKHHHVSTRDNTGSDNILNRISK